MNSDFARKSCVARMATNTNIKITLPYHFVTNFRISSSRSFGSYAKVYYSPNKLSSVDSLSPSSIFITILLLHIYLAHSIFSFIFSSFHPCVRYCYYIIHFLPDMLYICVYVCVQVHYICV